MAAFDDSQAYVPDDTRETIFDDFLSKKKKVPKETGMFESLRNAIGLGEDESERQYEPIEEAPRATIFDDFLTSKPARPEPQDGFLGSRPAEGREYDDSTWAEKHVTDRLDSGITGIQSGIAGGKADFVGRQLQTNALIDQGKPVLDADDPIGYQYMSAEERAKANQDLTESLSQSAADLTKLQKHSQAIPKNPNVAAALEAKDFDDFWTNFKKAPIEFVASIGVESLPAMAPGLALGGVGGLALRGGVGGFAAGMGAGSYGVDYASSVMEALQENGVDATNQEALEAAFKDKSLMEQVRKSAHAHAVPVAALDALSGVTAGAKLVPGSSVASKVGEGVAQTTTQGALGAGGETAGQVAQGKKELEIGQIAAEALGEFASAPIEVAGAGLSRKASKPGSSQTPQEPIQADSVPPAGAVPPTQAEATAPPSQGRGTPPASGWTPDGYRNVSVDGNGDWVSWMTDEAPAEAAGQPAAPEAPAASGTQESVDGTSNEAYWPNDEASRLQESTDTQATAPESAQSEPQAASPEPAVAPPPAPPEMDIAPDEPVTLVPENEGDEALKPENKTSLDRAEELQNEINTIDERQADLAPENGYGPMFDSERAELAEQRATLSQEHEAITKDWPKLAKGAETNFSTEANAYVEGQYALAEAGELVTSHDESLRVNPKYPQELQPRDRERASSEIQVANIVSKFNPNRLAASAEASNGSPIIGADGNVESGNGRTIAIKRIYQANGLKADEYRQYLKDNAQEFGLTPEQVDAMDKPVLVRVRTTPVDRAEFARQANATTVAQMSPSEQARSDASRMDAMDDLYPDDNGEFTNAASRAFIRRFMAKLPTTEQAAMVDANGMLSPTGYARVRNAVLAKAYGDSPVLQRMTESMDDNMRSISKAMMMVAPKVAKIKEAIGQGAVFDADITPDLLTAIEEMSTLKDAGTSVHDGLAQQGMFGEQYSPEVRELMQVLSDNYRSPKRIAAFITAYMEALESAGNPNQASLIGELPPPAKGDLINAAAKSTEKDGNGQGSDKQQDIFAQDESAGRQGAEQSTDAQGDKGRAQGNQEPEVAAKLPKELAGAKPRYNYGPKAFTLDFASDVDKAAFIAARENKSASDADYVKFVSDATGMTEAQVREHGNAVRDAIKAQAKTADAGALIVPEVERNAKPEAKPAAKPSQASPATEQAGKPKDAEQKPTAPTPKPKQAAMPTQDFKSTAGVGNIRAVKERYGDKFGVSWSSTDIATTDTMKQAAAIAKAVAESGADNIADMRKVADEHTSSVGKAAAATTNSDKPSVTPAGPRQKLEDFGERIAGARKDYAQEYADKMKAVNDDDVSSEPLSKSWPVPNYQSLLDGGADPVVVGFARAARESLPVKPRVRHKLRSWATHAVLLRDMTNTVLQGGDKAKAILSEARSNERLNDSVMFQADMYAELGHAKSLSGMVLSKGSYSVFNGVKHSPAKVIWSVENRAGSSARGAWPRQVATGDTRAQVVATFKEKYASMDSPTQQKKDTSFSIYSYRGKPGWVIGKKVGKTHLDLKSFDSVEDARAYLEGNQDALIKLLEKAKWIPNERRDSNQPRVGADHRQGVDVTPEAFTDAFAFRGVQFGNYVENARRQADLNNAYDALMDMAGMLEIPPKAISLNGKLGIAFGARGKGGANAASAHFEPDLMVINLTKQNGAGSLAHEWWHALDNYFSRIDQKSGGMLTESLNVKSASMGRPASAPSRVRPEMVSAYGGVVRAVANNGMLERSRNLDKRRTKAYWSTSPEMTARAFESYVINKLQDQQQANDYLANIVPESDWALENAYPYPTAGEIKGVRAAFDGFFQTIQSRQTNEGMALESRRQDHGTRPMWPVDEATDDLLREYGETIPNVLEAQRRFAKGDRIFVFHEMDEEAAELFGADQIDRLGSGAPDLLLSLPADIEGDAGVESRASISRPVRGFAKEIQDVADKIMASLPGANAINVRVVNRAAEVPESYEPSINAEGVYYPSKGGGTIYLVADNLPSIERAQQVLAHEVVGHYGMEALLGARFADVLADIERLTAVPKGVELGAQRPGDKYYATLEAVAMDYPDYSPGNQAREVLARMAEMGIKPGLIERVAGYIRTFLRSVGLVKRYTTAEIKGMVVDAANRLRTRTANESRAGVMDAAESLKRAESRRQEAGAITDTPAFKKWFGDSKVVDADGKPLVVYHGTQASFNTFDPEMQGDTVNSEDIGYFFTNYPKEADSYAAWDWDRESPTPNVMPVYLALKNPKIADTGKYEAPGVWYDNEGQNIALKAIEDGHDGLIARDTDPDAKMPDGTMQTMYVVFSPNQIKSATGNNGNFDPASDSIVESRAGTHAAGLLAKAKESLRAAIRLAKKNKTYTASHTVMPVFADEVQEARIHGLDITGFTHAIDGSAIRHTFKNHGNEKREAGRGQVAVTESDIEAIPDILAAPDRVFYGMKNDIGRDLIAYQKAMPNGTTLYLEEVRTGRKTLTTQSMRKYPRTTAAASIEKALRPTSKTLPGDELIVVDKPYDRNSTDSHPLESRAATGTERDSDGQRRQNQGSLDAMMTPDVKSQRRGPTNIFGQPVPATWQAPAETKLDNLIYTMQDKHVDTRRVVQSIKKAVGDIKDIWNPYLQEELYHGRAAKATSDFLQDELRPLLQQMQARHVSMRDFETYLHNLHAQERNEQIAKINPDMPDGGSGINTADAQAYLAGLNTKKKGDLQVLAKRVQEISAKTRKLLVASGLEMPETIAAWEETYANYVPLQREDMDFGSGSGTGQGYSVRGNSSKRAMGSGRNVVDILANISMQRERAITRAEKNRVATALYGLAVTEPNTDFWMAVNPAAVKDINQTAGELVQMGLNPLDAQSFISEPKQAYIDPRTGLVAYRINPAMRNNANVMSVRVNGQDRFVFFNETNQRGQRMVTALKNLDADQLGTAMNFMAKITRWLAAVNTQYNPIFGIVNFTRDTQAAVLQLSTTELRGKEAAVMGNTVSALRGIYSQIRADRHGTQTNSKWAALWDQFQRTGGKTGYRDQFQRSDERALALEKELKKIGEGKTRKYGRAMFDWLSDYNDTMENAVRLGAFKAALDNGITPERAASIAKNLTVNFNRKGQIATQASAMYAFFNAAVQGTTRMAEALAGPAGKKIIAGGFLLGVIQALALSAAGFDEEEPPEFVRERSLIIPIGGGRYITIPMPLGYNVLPNTGRIVTEFAMSGWRDPSKRIAQISGAFMDMFNPLGSAGWSAQTIAPTVADPLVALSENRDWTGKPIAKEDFSSLSPTPGYTRAKENASVVGGAVSYAINALTGGTDFKPGILSPTPDQIDYLIGQAFGGVGRETNKIVDTGKNIYSGEETPPYKIPLVGRFYGNSGSGAAESSRFYENMREINMHDNEIKGRREAREDVAGYLRDNPEASMAAQANRAYSDVRSMRKNRSRMLDNGSSRERIKQIDAQITARMKQLNDQVRRLRENVPSR